MPAVHSAKKRGRSSGKSSGKSSSLSAGAVIYTLLLLILVAGSIGGTMYYYTIMKPFDYQGDALASIKSTGTLVLVARQNLKANDKLIGTYEVVGLPNYALPSDALSELDVSRMLAIGEIKAGTILTRSNTYNPDAVAADENTVNYLIGDLFKYDWLNNGDYVDVRLLRYNITTGRTDDYVVLAKKKINISENRKFATLALTENEIVLVRRADVEARLAAKSSKENPYSVQIYATVYREPGIQKPSVVTYSGINVVVSTPGGGISLDDILKNNIDITDDMGVSLTEDAEFKEKIGISEEISTEIPEPVIEPETKTEEQTTNVDDGEGD